VRNLWVCRLRWLDWGRNIVDIFNLQVKVTIIHSTILIEILSIKWSSKFIKQLVILWKYHKFLQWFINSVIIILSGLRYALSVYLTFFLFLPIRWFLIITKTFTHTFLFLHIDLLFLVSTILLINFTHNRSILKQHSTLILPFLIRWCFKSYHSRSWGVTFVLFRFRRWYLLELCYLYRIQLWFLLLKLYGERWLGFTMNLLSDSWSRGELVCWLYFEDGLPVEYNRFFHKMTDDMLWKLLNNMYFSILKRPKIQSIDRSNLILNHFIILHHLVIDPNTLYIFQLPCIDLYLSYLYNKINNPINLLMWVDEFVFTILSFLIDRDVL